jgi:hypothetical protein
MNGAKAIPGKAQDPASGGAAGARKVVRFFSVEGQRRRLEFAKLPPARAMTPEEESRYLGELQAQEKASREKAEAQEKAARERAAREKAARSRAAAAAAGRGGRAANDTSNAGPEAREVASGLRKRGRHAAGEQPSDADSELTRRRSGGRSAAASGQKPSPGLATSTASVSVAAQKEVDEEGAARPAEVTRKKVMRRGVIGAPEPRQKE